MDQDIAPFTIANGSSFQFTDELYQAFGTFMTVSFGNNQIRRHDPAGPERRL